VNKTLTILAGLGLVTAGAIIGNELIGDAQAYEPSASDCAVMVRVYGGTCAEHIDMLLAEAAKKALRQEQATRAAGVELLDAADIAALDAKIKIKQAEKAEEQEPE